jgi:membrane protease YdiL (CAAX protease family)
MELVTCAIMVIAYRVLVRLVERRGASELAFDASTAFASRGALFGAALFCAVYAVLWASGSANYLGFDGLGGVLFAFGISIAAAFGEEIIVRGGIFRVIEEGFGTLAALIFSASLFGALHTVNNGATLVSTVSIALEAGVLLGLAYTATRSLWFPIGIHFGWNFTEGGIFGRAEFPAVGAGAAHRRLVRAGGVGGRGGRVPSWFRRGRQVGDPLRTLETGLMTPGKSLLIRLSHFRTEIRLPHFRKMPQRLHRAPRSGYGGCGRARSTGVPPFYRRGISPA